MHNRDTATTCGKPLVSFTGRQSASGVGGVAQEHAEVIFLIPAACRLNLNLHELNNKTIEYLCHRIARDPADLRSHVQRIHLCLRDSLEAPIFGALLDLYIALGKKGHAIRKRMLELSHSKLSDQNYTILREGLPRGISAADPIRGSEASMLTRGYVGTEQLLRMQQEVTQTRPDPVALASDYLLYGQVDNARLLLEEAVLKEPWRKDLQNDLLEIYLATRDGKNCKAMYDRLSNKFIPDHHAWTQTVARIDHYGESIQ